MTREAHTKYWAEISFQLNFTEPVELVHSDTTGEFIFDTVYSMEGIEEYLTNETAVEQYVLLKRKQNEYSK